MLEITAIIKGGGFMNKKLVFCLSVMLLFSVLFSSAFAQEWVNHNVIRSYLYQQGAHHVNVYYKRNSDFLGNRKHWKRMIENGNWKGETRPDPTMGDANIDGKVNAIDALFALHFSVNGNIQTYTACDTAMTPPTLKWPGNFSTEYHNGTLLQKVELEEFWVEYCFYNSPFFADVTKDCNVNAKDALKILQYSVGITNDFPIGDLTSPSNRFCYYPWPTEYYIGVFNDLVVDMTVEEFCEKYNFDWDISPTDQ